MMRKLFPLFLLLALSACEAHENEAWLGYVEGEAVLVAPPQPGWLTAIPVARGQQIAAGDLLFRLDETRERAARDNAAAALAAAEARRNQALAALAQAAAQLARTEQELARQRELVARAASPMRELEQAQAAYDGARASRDLAQAQIRQAEAQIEEARAGLTTAEWNLSERTVTARASGDVQDIFFRQGEFAAAGVPVVSILPPENVFVRFFVPEEQIAALQLGDPVRIGCDGCPSDLRAQISFIAADAEYTPPVIYSLTNRARLVFKVEARFAADPGLRPGLPVDVFPAGE